MLGGDALVAGHDDLAVGSFDVEGDGLALQAFGHEGKFGADGAQREAIEVEEARKDVLGRKADGLEKDRAGHLEVDDVLRVEFKVKPGAAVRNHARGEKKLPGGMSLALVVLEEDARGAVQLADDDALGPVDDEGALLRHERDFAHVDVVLADFLHGFRLRGFAIVDLKTNLGAQAAAERKTAQLALGDVELGLGEFVVDELEASVTVVAADREDGRECCLKPDGSVAGGRSDIRLQEFFVGTKLSIKQGRHFKDARTRGKALPNALLFSERVRHGHSVRH